MAFVNEYKNRGGKVGVGTDSGYVLGLYGFSCVRELEMLQGAGFHPLEVVRVATLHGAEILAKPAGRHRGRSVDARTIAQDVLEGRPVPEKALDGLLFESLSTRVAVEVVRGTRVHATVGRDRNNRDSESTRRLGAGVSTSSLARTGFDVAGTYSRIDRAGAARTTSITCRLAAVSALGCISPATTPPRSPSSASPGRTGSSSRLGHRRTA